MSEIIIPSTIWRGRIATLSPEHGTQKKTAGCTKIGESVLIAQKDSYGGTESVLRIVGKITSSSISLAGNELKRGLVAEKAETAVGF